MNSSIRFIFKTLTKIPITILAVYAVFNIFAFSLTYFKLLGLSYVVMQTAVENNYLPTEEYNTLNNYLQSITDTGVVDNASIIIQDPNDTTIKPATQKRQYGMPVTVGVQAHYKFIWPLMPKEQLNDTSSGFIGYGSNANANFSGYASDGELESRREDLEDNQQNMIKIQFTVPGLKYYPDLL